jgi:endoglycosylceramidase
VGIQDRYAAAWRHVASRFRSVPGVLGYELFNEPFPGSGYGACATPQGCPMLDATLLTPFSQKMLDAIRETDSEHMVWYEPWVLFDGGAPTFHGKLDDPRVGMSFHDYQPLDDYEIPLHNAELQNQRTGDALLMTEFGATEDDSAITAAFEAADRAMMPAIYWAYANKAPFQVVVPGGSIAGAQAQGLVYDLNEPLVPGNVLEEKWDAFVRPYPQAVAGTPLNWSFQTKGKVFKFSYSTQRADGSGQDWAGIETEVLIPDRQYHGCYAAAVSGARVVSAPNMQILRLTADLDADQVTLRVEPC